MKKITIQIFIICILINQIFAEKNDYKNPKLPVEKRVADLLSKMTIEEKFWQLFMIPGDLSQGKEKYQHGIFGLQVATAGLSGDASQQILQYGASGSAKKVAEKINSIQRYFVEETRLGIPIIPFDEALHGLIRDGATAFPQSIGLAATWDTSLVSDVAQAVARETRTRGIRQILSPVIDLGRDVRWGRVEETYGEDTFITTQMAVAFVSPFEKMGVITTPKHFLANWGAGGRDSYPIHDNERYLEEVYFPAWKKCIRQGGTQSIMTSYNSVDGSPSSANDWLLNRKLKQEWGFTGFVISDAGAVPGIRDLHKTVETYAESGAEALKNGLDVLFQTSYNHFPLFYEAVEKGMIEEEIIDAAVARVLRAKFQLGLFENPYVNPDEAQKWNGHKTHRELAKRAALESIVLLKNENQTLPLSKNINSIAVIGADAVEARLGGYSGPGIDKVSILDGIKEKVGNKIKVNFTRGCGRTASEFKTIRRGFLFHLEEGKQVPGLAAEYFNNISLEGKPELSRTDSQIQFGWTLFSPQPDVINFDWFSVRWTGKLKAPKTGDFKIGLEGNDGYRLFINDELIIDNWQKQTFQTVAADYHFEKDKVYDLKVEFFESVGNVKLRLVWNVGIKNSWQKEIDKAVLAAKKSDAAVVVAGIDEGEFRDRALLGLPGYQEEMILQVAATGKPVVVVLIGGSAITMTNWMNDVNAILDAWYPGEVGGPAVADVLFGDYNPAGRLPITFPVHEAQLPLYYRHKPTGRGDDYINLTGRPLFPFGFGLSYTSFKYSDMKIEKENIKPDESTVVQFTVKNTGKMAGDEVIQLYIKDLLASVSRPVMELKGFQRVHLKPGESKQLEFEITPESLTMLDKNLKPVVEPGEFKVMIGASSADIRLRGVVEVN